MCYIGNIYHQYTPILFAYIPAPWILWDIHIYIYIYIYIYITLWLFTIAVENGPFIEDFPIKTSICEEFSMAMLNNQSVYYDYFIHVAP